MRGISPALIIFSFLIQVVVTRMGAIRLISTLFYICYTSTKSLLKEVGKKAVLLSS